MLSLVYLTSREDPKFEWFIESFYKQIRSKRISFQVIFIDFFLQYDDSRREKLKTLIQDRFPFIHSPPKPTPWQGKYRLTKEDWFAASNARNTGIALSAGNYVAFVDDLSVLLPGWVDQIIHAMEHEYIVAGSYKKVKNLIVKDGDIISFDEYPPGIDARWDIGSEKGIVPIESGGMYGCSFGAPMEGLLIVNGLEEACDGQAGEDYDLSIRLVKAGYRLFYNRNMCTYESEELHHTGKIMKRAIKSGKIIGKDKEGNSIIGPDASHVILNRVRQENRTNTIGNHFILRQLRELVTFQGKPFPLFVEPKKHWYDGQPIAEM